LKLYLICSVSSYAGMLITSTFRLPMNVLLELPILKMADSIQLSNLQSRQSMDNMSFMFSKKHTSQVISEHF